MSRRLPLKRGLLCVLPLATSRPTQAFLLPLPGVRVSTVSRFSTQPPQDKPGSWGSLVPETLRDMQAEAAAAAATATTPDGQAQQVPAGAGLKKLLSIEERKRRRRALDQLGIKGFNEFLRDQGLTLKRAPSTVLQLNVGLYCNQACNHCHVESSPKRTEMMSEEVAERCLELLRRSPSLTTLDLTGGAPELNSQFRRLVKGAAALKDRTIIDRCNLTVLEEPGQEDLAQFLAEHKVQVVASLPCYTEKTVNMQRGKTVFQRSIAGLKKLNALGYGREGSGLDLCLVYNPSGAFLPPSQAGLETQYKKELMEQWGIEFNKLYTITNMPIKRFADFLSRRGEMQAYMELLVRSFNPESVDNAMCRTHVSVDWQGRVYDCDFNQQLDMGLMGRSPASKGQHITVFDIESVEDLEKHHILMGSHCFGCTAGEGSSCQGATTPATAAEASA